MNSRPEDPLDSEEPQNNERSCPESLSEFSSEDTSDPFFGILRQYEESIDAKNPLTLEQLIQRYPRYRDRLAKYFRYRASLQGLNAENSVELCDTDRYKQIRMHDRGGMGAVFLAHDSDFNRPAILKVPLAIADSDAKARSRMERETLLSGHLQHPNILPIFEKGTISTTDGRNLPYFSMRFLEGRSLDELLGERGQPDRDYMRFVLLFQQVCRAMAYCHSQMIVNLDLKPRNVMIGNFNDAYVIDWGLAIQLPSQSPQALRPELQFPSGFQFDVAKELTSMGGTDAYAPPEIKERAIDIGRLDFKRIDVFCLGGILCKILTGAAPFQDGQKLTTAIHRIQRSAASHEIKQIALRCLSDRPEDRPVDAADVERMISSFVVSQEQSKLRSERRLRNMTIGIAVAILIAVTTISVLANRRTKFAGQQAFFASGLRSISAGNLPEAEKQFSEGIKMGNAPLKFHVKRLRSALMSLPREQALREAEQLLNASPNREADGELLLILGDLKACDPKLWKDWRTDIKAALETRQLSQADEHYANSLLEEDIVECQRHLKLALAHERFHPRAASLNAAVLLASGRLTEARRQAEFYLTVFPEDVSLQAVSEACSALKDSSYNVKSFSEKFDRRLEALRRGFLPDVGTNDNEPTDQFAFARQGIVARNAANLIRELPAVSKAPGLPIAVFESRARHWKQLAQLASRLGAPKNIFDVASRYLGDSEEDAKQLAEVSRNEFDALPSLVLGISKFVSVASNYDDWSKNRPDQLQDAFIEIDEILTQCFDRETIAPRGQFELAIRIVRFMVNLQMTKTNKNPSAMAEKKVQQDLDQLRELTRQHPQMLAITCKLVLDLYQASESSHFPATQLDIANQLRFANHWTTERPDDVQAWLASARVWLIIKSPANARKDLEKSLALDPKLKEARQLLDSPDMQVEASEETSSGN